ncbi:MAG: D-glutamate deacylase [Gemmatimonadales bacterium]|nr:MAG: D-glutamate deacylase [Gemmatimonadales bacterium]
MKSVQILLGSRLILLGTLALGAGCGPESSGYDLVLRGGRVMDPESGLNATRDVGVTNGKITAISETQLTGAQTLDASGMVVAPGFIDLHAHGQDEENYRLYAMDGVTTALELEVGTEDVDAFYDRRAGTARVNYGASISHVRSRMQVFGETGTSLLPEGEGGYGIATPAHLGELRARLRRGLAQGALGVGMGLQYTPGATRSEVLDMFRVAAEARAPVFVHVRAFGPSDPGSITSFMEVIAAAAITGAPLHIVHLNSMSLGDTPATLQIVEEARAHGLDVTTEAYPYSAGMTEIQSALLDQYDNAPDSIYAKLQWIATGERLTRRSFRAYRRQGGMVILHLNTPEMEALAIESPLTIVASDGGLTDGLGHPRTAGTFARILAHYVRDRRTLSLMDALRKMSLMPAQRLEQRAPMFLDKGRIRVGADADLVVFDPSTVSDRSTYQDPAAPAKGFHHVLVAGVPVIRDGTLQDGVFPGKPARAPVSP